MDWIHAGAGSCAASGPGNPAVAPSSAADPMAMTPPNPRVQRTRPCASLRGSPLTRHPLGGPLLTLPMSALVVVCLASCVTFQGKSYPSRSAPRFVASSACQPIEQSAQGTVRVLVRDADGAPLPGLDIRFDSPNHRVQGTSNKDGEITVALGPGNWVLNPDPGDRHDGFEFAVPDGSACTITCVMRVVTPIVE